MKENQLKRYSVQTENKENGKQIKVYGHWRDYLKLNKSVEYPPHPHPPLALRTLLTIKTVK